jgi:hypothetical protein
MRLKELTSSKEIKVVEKSIQVVMGKLGYAIDSISRGSKKILLDTARTTKETLKQYGIKYHITEDKPSKTDEYFVKINDKDYIYFDNVTNELQKELVKSFMMIKVSTYNIQKQFGTTEFFDNLIFKITGKMSATFLILSNLENIVDPVVTQVLINQQLPYKLNEIMYYMSSRVVEGYVQDRNDILNQRIRGSEVLVLSHLLLFSLNHFDIYSL